VWHQADSEPHAQERYIEMLDLVKAWRKWSRRVDAPLGSEKAIIQMTLIGEMEVTLADTKDVEKAIAKVMPFFRTNFQDSEKGARFKGSLMFNQVERAKHVPDCCTSMSNMYRPARFWKTLEEAEDEMDDEEDMEALPEEWDLKTRPIIAQCKFFALQDF
jgi:hypothetical protein